MYAITKEEKKKKYKRPKNEVFEGSDNADWLVEIGTCAHFVMPSQMYVLLLINTHPLQSDWLYYWSL